MENIPQSTAWCARLIRTCWLKMENFQSQRDWQGGVWRGKSMRTWKTSRKSAWSQSRFPSQILTLFHNLIFSQKCSASSWRMTQKFLKLKHPTFAKVEFLLLNKDQQRIFRRLPGLDNHRHFGRELDGM